jgi:hypothetical protein
MFKPFLEAVFRSLDPDAQGGVESPGDYERCGGDYGG